jgi:hypothetical protein
LIDYLRFYVPLKNGDVTIAGEGLQNFMASPFTIYSKNNIFRKIIEISPILKRYLCTRERYLFMLERYLFNKKRYLIQTYFI